MCSPKDHDNPTLPWPTNVSLPWNAAVAVAEVHRFRPGVQRVWDWVLSRVFVLRKPVHIGEGVGLGHKKPNTKSRRRAMHIINGQLTQSTVYTYVDGWQ